MELKNLITYVTLILLFSQVKPFWWLFKKKRCKDDQKARITIGILGLTFGSQTYERHRDRLEQILDQIENKIPGDSIEFPRKKKSRSDEIRSYLKENEFMYYQNIDRKVKQQNPDYETFLEILKEHNLNFQDKKKFCKNDGSNEPLEANEGNDYLYYSCLLYTSPSPRDLSTSRMPSSA